MRFLRIFLLVLGCLAAFPAAGQANPSLSVNAVRIGVHPEGTRLVVDLSARTDFRSFLLQNPSRLVIDLPSFSWNTTLSKPPAGSMVGNIRNGLLQPGISRIVVDLESAATLKSAFMLPAGPSVPDRLVIDLAKAPSGYDFSKERMFGSLNSQSPAPAAQTTASTGLPPPPAKPTTQKEEDTPPPVSQNPGKKPMIILDAGHGGQDPGALGPGGKREKDVTLAAAKEVKRQLEATGRYRVQLTRSSDVFIKLQDRVAISRKKGGDLFISLHADSVDKPNVRGASIYTLSNKASDAQTAKLAARENRADLIAGVDLSHEDKQVANILIDLAMRDTMNQSKYFANTIVKQAGSNGLRMLEKPHRFAGFAVLKAPDIPSVLIEMGFMSNPSEVAALSSDEYRRKIAKTIVGGVDLYFAKVHKNGQN